MVDDTKKQLILNELREGRRLDEIAVRHGVTIGTVSIMGKDNGVPPRNRGCRVKLRPSPMDWDIVLAVNKSRSANGEHLTLEKIGRRFGHFSRARVHRIYKKWKSWKPVSPFARHDVIRFMERDYKVIKPDIFTGLVKDLETNEQSIIPWFKSKYVVVRDKHGVPVREDGKIKQKMVTHWAVKL